MRSSGTLASAMWSSSSSQSQCTHGSTFDVDILCLVHKSTILGNYGAGDLGSCTSKRAIQVEGDACLVDDVYPTQDVFVEEKLYSSVLITLLLTLNTQSHVEQMAWGTKHCMHWTILWKCKALESVIVESRVWFLSHIVPATNGRKFEQPIFIRGGNWILLGGLLRLSEDRYNIDVGSHADIKFAAINLNMICMWRGALDEQPDTILLVTAWPFGKLFQLLSDPSINSGPTLLHLWMLEKQ